MTLNRQILLLGLSTAGFLVDALSLQDKQQRQEWAAFASQELIPAARSAILPYYRQPQDMGTEIKVDDEGDRSDAQTHSPVTLADRAAEAAMRTLIQERYPSHGIIGEEYGSKEPTASDVCWVLDPIDGTKSFITGQPLFGTLIGICYQGVPVVGVIDTPVLKEQWIGILDDEDDDNMGGCSGGVTTLNGDVVHSRGVAQLSESIMYSTTPHMFRRGFETERFETVRDACQMTLYGTDCYGYGLVASGFGAHLVVEADLGVYDYAALVPVMKGAGGFMTDWNGKDLTIQGFQECRGRVVAAANAILHREALKLLCDEG